MTPLSDKDIRDELIERLKQPSKRFGPQPRLIPELDVRGRTRIDVGVLGAWSELHGYEIKSDKDTLRRLPHQIEIYGRVVSTATLVVTDSHLAEAKRMLPQWWAIHRAYRGPRDAVLIGEVRRGRHNKYRDCLMITGLLWRVETLKLMRERGMDKRAMRGGVELLHKRLLAHVQFGLIQERVCECLWARQGSLRGIQGGEGGS